MFSRTVAVSALGAALGCHAAWAQFEVPPSTITSLLRSSPKLDVPVNAEIVRVEVEVSDSGLAVRGIVPSPRATLKADSILVPFNTLSRDGLYLAVTWLAPNASPSFGLGPITELVELADPRFVIGEVVVGDRVEAGGRREDRDTIFVWVRVAPRVRIVAFRITGGAVVGTPRWVELGDRIRRTRFR